MDLFCLIRAGPQDEHPSCKLIKSLCIFHLWNLRHRGYWFAITTAAGSDAHSSNPVDNIQRWHMKTVAFKMECAKLLSAIIICLSPLSHEVCNSKSGHSLRKWSSWLCYNRQNSQTAKVQQALMWLFKIISKVCQSPKGPMHVFFHLQRVLLSTASAHFHDSDTHWVNKENVQLDIKRQEQPVKSRSMSHTHLYLHIP